jgi:hypothetical protein
MANVDVLFLRLGAALFHDRAAVEHGAEAGRIVRRICSAIAVALLIVGLTSCATTSTHQFAEPKGDWQMRTGQLLYRNANRTVVGDVVVRYSSNGDFELTVSKGPGINLLILRQDPAFADVKGPMAGRGWSGPVDHAPPPLRGWVELRDAIAHAKDRHLVRHSSGSETFVFRF